MQGDYPVGLITRLRTITGLILERKWKLKTMVGISFIVVHILISYNRTINTKMMYFAADKIIDWSRNTGGDLLCKYKETEIITWARTTTQEHGFDKTVKESKQINMESDKETNGGIFERESFGVMKSPYENRISDWISEISTDQSDANLLEDRTSSSSENNIDINIGSSWFEETRDFEEFSCSLWS